ncbi:PF13754 domain-containing protein [Faecalimonas sp.]
MIVKLIGKVDGKEVIFERKYGDIWEAIVPYDLDGMYVVEIVAFNDAGTQVYRTKMLLIVDPSTLCISLIPCEYEIDVLLEEYTVDDVTEEYGIEVIYPRRC